VGTLGGGLFDDTEHSRILSLADLVAHPAGHEESEEHVRDDR